jgi:thiamine-monophosphate kinase
MHQPSSGTEFDLIRRYFTGLGTARPDVELGVGDDAALLRLPPGKLLAVSVDTLVSGIHFLPSASPEGLGHKALAVNLSDLAAMGAEPAWATLALTLPAADESWLRGFAGGFAALAKRYGIALIGGDTTRGPLSITVQVQGLVPEGAALRRSGAKVGDGIYVTGELGDAALCLKLMQRGAELPPEYEALRHRLERPQPRVEAGLALRDLANSAIDISDGLVADLGHVLDASAVGASLELSRLPLSRHFTRWLAGSGDWAPALVGGDDYELCFTAPPEREPQLQCLATELGLALSRVGSVEAAPGLRVRLPDGTPWPIERPGFDHFAGGD